MPVTVLQILVQRLAQLFDSCTVYGKHHVAPFIALLLCEPTEYTKRSRPLESPNTVSRQEGVRLTHHIIHTWFPSLFLPCR
jgi:hypothetical protein